MHISKKKNNQEPWESQALKKQEFREHPLYADSYDFPGPSKPKFLKLCI